MACDQQAKATTPEYLPGTITSLASLPATAQRRRLVFAVGALLLAAFAAMVPFAGTPLPEFNAFVPSVSAVMVINDVITAVLLYAQYSIAPSRCSLVLAGGYLFAALMLIPYALTFPGAVTPTGLLGAQLQSAAWLFFSSHLVFLGVLLGYARLKDIDRRSALQLPSARSAIGWSVVGVFMLVSVLVWITTAKSQYLPEILSDRTHLIQPNLTVIAITIIAVAAIAFAELWIRRRTVLDYWLMLICAALIQEQVFLLLSRARFTVGFYLGRVFWLITSVVVLILLLHETTRLYGRLARSYVLLERERDNKLLSASAITASIAHEVRQPLTAIIASGDAALAYLRKTPPENEKARSSLDRIVSEGHRTGEVIDGFRALFEKSDYKLEAVDLNEVVKSALDSLRGELTDHGVQTLSEFTELPLIQGRRNLLQQVVFNLAHNALEAMATTTHRRRILRLKSERHGETAVAIVVEDTGPGIDPVQLDSIFNAFVTTKSRGMGLGLAISRQIVEHHGGQLLVFSDGVTGATFQVVLPIASTENARAHFS